MEWRVCVFVKGREERRKNEVGCDSKALFRFFGRLTAHISSATGFWKIQRDVVNPSLDVHMLDMYSGKARWAAAPACPRSDRDRTTSMNCPQPQKSTDFRSTVQPNRKKGQAETE